MNITDIKEFAISQGVELKKQNEIAQIASDNIAKRFNYNKDQIKDNFDNLLEDTEKEAYKVYLGFEKTYSEEIFSAFAVILLISER